MSSLLRTETRRLSAQQKAVTQRIFSNMRTHTPCGHHRRTTTHLVPQTIPPNGPGKHGRASQQQTSSVRLAIASGSPAPRCVQDLQQRRPPEGNGGPRNVPCLRAYPRRRGRCCRHIRRRHRRRKSGGAFARWFLHLSPVLEARGGDDVRPALDLCLMAARRAQESDSTPGVAAVGGGRQQQTLLDNAHDDGPPTS